jgi:hypothetical protein
METNLMLTYTLSFMDWLRTNFKINNSHMCSNMSRTKKKRRKKYNNMFILLLLINIINHLLNKSHQRRNLSMKTTKELDMTKKMNRRNSMRRLRKVEL